MIDLAFPVGVTLRSGVSSTKSQYASRQEEIRQEETGRQPRLRGQAVARRRQAALAGAGAVAVRGVGGVMRDAL